MKERIFNVHWEGPLRWADLNDKKKIVDSHVLYAIYGNHPTYGRNVLLYIGITKRGMGIRLSEHEDWLEQEYGDISFRIASIGEISTWKEWHEFDRYDSPLQPYIIKQIEKLLIYSHQPAYNEREKGTFNFDAHFRVFNTGEIGDLLPEVSCIYHDNNW